MFVKFREFAPAALFCKFALSGRIAEINLRLFEITITVLYRG